MEVFYYIDYDYNELVVMPAGVKPSRTTYPADKAPPTNGTKINSPPDANPAWYIGEGFQWRKEPVRRPNLMREVQHFVMGLAFGILPVLAYWMGDWQAVVSVLGLLVLVTHLFLRYEETEEVVLNDWGYRDIGGYMMGLSVTGLGGMFVSIILKWVM